MFWKEINPIRDQAFQESMDLSEPQNMSSRDEILLVRIMDPSNRLFTIADDDITAAMAEGFLAAIQNGLATQTGLTIDRKKFMQLFNEVALDCGYIEYMEFTHDPDFESKTGYQHPRDIYCLSSSIYDDRITSEGKEYISVWDEITLREIGVDVDQITRPDIKNDPSEPRSDLA